MLAKSVIDKFRKDKRTKVCHYFFKDDAQIQASSENAFCALLHQLFDGVNKLNCELRRYIEIRENNLCADFASLWELLTLASEIGLSESTSEDRKEIVCVLDALDECEGYDRGFLIRRLTEYFNPPPKNSRLKFFLTSRPYPTVIKAFPRLGGVSSLIHIEDDDANKSRIREEIQLVINDRIDQLVELRKLNTRERCQLSEHLKRDTLSTTYLWVDLIYEELRNEDNLRLPKKEWLELAGSFPLTVDAIYNKILSDAKDPNETRTLLHIILVAKRPLTWREMDVALEVQRRPGCKYLDDLSLENDEEGFKRRFRASVGFFVTIHDEKLYLIHQTARQFLLKPDPAPGLTWLAKVYITLFGPWKWILDDLIAMFIGRTWKHSVKLALANRTLAEICVTYLSLGILKSDRPHDDHSLWRYAATQWFEHVEHSKSMSRRLMKEFMEAPDPSFSAYSRWSIWWSKDYVQTHNLHEKNGGMYLPAGLFGYEPPFVVNKIVSSLWRHTRTRSSKKNIESDRLCKLLKRAILEIIFGIDSTDEEHRNLLKTMERFLREAPRKLRIPNRLELFREAVEGIWSEWSYGVAKDTLMVFGQFPLPAKLPPELFPSLLKIVSGVNLFGNDTGIPLIILAEHGKPKHIELLIHRGADVNAVTTTGKYATALIAAIGAERDDNAKVLLQRKDIDVNITASTGDYGTTLIAACVRRDCDFTSRLIELGAEINATTTTGSYATALIAAIGAECDENAEVLLQRKNIDVNITASTGDYGTALIAACTRPSLYLASRLIDLGAKMDIVATTGKYATALIAACARNSVGVVRLLLRHDAGVNVSVSHGNLDTALIAATDAFSAWAVLELVNKQADINEAVKSFARKRLRRGFLPPLILALRKDITAYNLATTRLRTALILQQLGLADKLKPRHIELIEDASKCLSMGCSTVLDLRAANVVASGFGTDKISVGIAQRWCKTLRSFSTKNHKWEEILRLLTELLNTLDNYIKSDDGMGRLHIGNGEDNDDSNSIGDFDIGAEEDESEIDVTSDEDGEKGSETGG